MTGADQFTIRWTDFEREPQCAPDPRYPKGLDVNGARGAAASCSTDLPYPAKRCGAYDVRCKLCGATIALTTAGRPDDPRSVKLACRRKML